MLGKGLVLTGSEAELLSKEYPHTNVLEDLSVVKLTQLSQGEVREILPAFRS
jgi:hypothetical protein